MKKLVVGLGVAALALSTTAMAANEGWYAGVEAGYDKYSNTGVDSTYATTYPGVKVTDTSGLAAAIKGGYNFTQNFGVQVALTKYSDMKFKDTAGDSQTVKVSSADIMAMGYLPLDDQFDLFGGVGIARVVGKASHSDDSKETRPKALVGVSYALDQNWSANLSYNRVFGAKEVGDNDYTPTISSVMLGLNYSFN